MSNRVEKLNKLFLHEISEIINREIEFEEMVLVTVTCVKIDPELSQAKVWVSVLPFEKSAMAILQLKKSGQIIKEILNKKIKIRKMPRLTFLIDDTENEAHQLEDFMSQIKD